MVIALACFIQSTVSSANTSMKLRKPTVVSTWSAVNDQTNCLRHEITLELPRDAHVYTGPTSYDSNLLTEYSTPWAVPTGHRVKGAWQLYLIKTTNIHLRAYCSGLLVRAQRIP